MADDTEKAILISFNYGGAVDPALKERAGAYITSIKQSPDCWKLCVERFGSSGYVEVKFWCLQTLHEIVRTYYTQLDSNSQGAIKGALLTWLQRDCAQESAPLPSFLRNKLAQTLVGVVQLEYPTVWPSFFRDLIAAATQGPGLADMFCRILVSIDEDIISLDIPRSQAESKLSMHVKDSMREHCIGDVAQACYNMAKLYKHSHPELSAMVLGAIARYVHWIDIGLVANDKFIPLLLELMESSSLAVRAAATEVVMEVVNKRMEPVAKIQLVQQLKIVPALANWTAAVGAAAAAIAAQGKAGAAAGGSAGGGGPGQLSAAAQSAAEMLEDEETLGKYARLLAVTAGEVMDALKRVENSIISFTAMGFSVNDEASQEATAAVEAALQLLDALTPAVLQAFGTGVECLAMPLVPFISAYVARLKTLAKRNQGMPANAGLHLQKILEGIAVNVRYPDDGPNAQQAVAAAAAGGASARVVVSEADALAAREEQWEVEERRKELFVLLKNVAKLAWDEVVAFVGQLLQQVMGQQPAALTVGMANGSMGSLSSSSAAAAGHGGEGAARQAHFQDVEVAVTFLYEIGEGAPEEALKAGAAAAGGGLSLAQLVLVLLSGGAHVPSGDHRIVSLAVMETAVRYCRIVQQQQGVIPEVLTLFCGPRGIAHPYPDVSTRACYLFARLVKQLRSNVRPYVAEILQNLEPQLRAVATAPPAGSSGGLSSCSSKDGTLFASGSGSRDPSGKNLAPSTSVIDDRLYVFEAVGLLLGQEELDAARQQETLRSLLQTLTQQIEGNLQAAAAAAAAAGNGGRSLPLLVQGRPGPVWLMLQAVEAIIRVNKGFRADLCTKSRPQLGALFLQCLEVAVAIPKTLPGHRQLRARFIALLHRLVECLLAHILPYLPPALEALMHSQVDAADMVDVLNLLVQLVLRFKEALAGLMEALLPPLTAQVHCLLGADWDWSGQLASPAALSQATASSSSGGSTIQQQQQNPGVVQQQQQGLQVAVTLEDAREKGELQRAYYSLLHAIAHNNLSQVLMRSNAQVLDLELTAITRGAATHVDPAVRRTCLQVFTRLLGDWCANGETIPGFKRFAMERLGGDACIVGLLRTTPGSTPLDARDAATVALIGEVSLALKLLYEKCGEEFAAHLGAQVLPPMGVPVELQQQLLYLVREGDAKQLKECLRGVLMAQAAGAS